MTYRDAQNIIDNKGLNGVTLDGKHQISEIEQDVRVLQSIAKQLRSARFNNGALSLEGMKIKFTLDENGLPSDCGPYERTESNLLVEEVSSCSTKGWYIC